MIENSEQLEVTLQQLSRLYRILDGMRSEYLPGRPKQYELFAEGPLDEIERFQRSLDQYFQSAPKSAAERSAEPLSAES